MKKPINKVIPEKPKNNIEILKEKLWQKETSLKKQINIIQEVVNDILILIQTRKF